MVLIYLSCRVGWMRRPEFIAALGIAAAWQIVARAQPHLVPMALLATEYAAHSLADTVFVNPGVTAGAALVDEVSYPLPHDVQRAAGLAGQAALSGETIGSAARGLSDGPTLCRI
jgi:hypothetical protein